MNETGGTVRVYDLRRQMPAQLTFNADRTGLEVAWSPDSRHLVYASKMPDGSGLSWARAGGSGEPQLLLQAAEGLRPPSFTLDGRRLAYSIA